ncbi:tRNA (adenosine(37)-N6)-threonylcarbamoyltransferase complex ATPase subunit type 1 TsaE [Candidatus Saccharibacteria bacterium]|nr:MAG: tRNA (adenosine(37)-N6)-threonylcarbamoyltransferase complex ATPase subunit type 1 TsaE [Candidatus Saccharibacteria bacterium]
MQSQVTLDDEAATMRVGESIGRVLRGGDLVELRGDVGAGKTTLTRAIARGMGIVDEPVQSPTFTLSRVYDSPSGLRLIHYDFYRLSEPGIMASELADAIDDPQAVVIIEWADAVEGVLPVERTTIVLEAVSEQSRRLTMLGAPTRLRACCGAVA